jgi:nucleotidyltransferase/DNA polymerase involved in DNA repair
MVRQNHSRSNRQMARGNPVGCFGVLGNQGACVIAKSYEMKAQGVKTGMAVCEAQKFCPDGLCVRL